MYVPHKSQEGDLYRRKAKSGIKISPITDVGRTGEEQQQHGGISVAAVAVAVERLINRLYKSGGDSQGQKERRRLEGRKKANGENVSLFTPPSKLPL